jgi:5S rRNA maturation endonuclease (ribonuclease M5)
MNALNTLTHKAIEQIDAIYRYFNIEYLEFPQMMRSKCHIHGGDNKTAFNLYHKGDVIHYKCRTHHCEEYFGKSFVSMIRGLLSHNLYHWEQPGNKTATFLETIKFLEQILGLSTSDLKDQIETNDKDSFSNLMLQFDQETECATSGLSRIDIRKTLSIPSQYFLKRGFSASILDTYDVGDCNDTNHDMKYRATVPIYDENYYYVGCTGRSFYEKCDSCGYYHHPKSQCLNITKWKHSLGLKRNICLYNLNRAKRHIVKTHTVVLVESPGNVWRLEEAGIHNSVAIFGTAIQENQRFLLDMSGVMAVIVLMDNDEAGRKATERIRKKFNKLYGLYFPIIKKPDIANMSVQEIQDSLKPFIDNIIGVYS